MKADLHILINRPSKADTGKLSGHKSVPWYSERKKEKISHKFNRNVNEGENLFVFTNKNKEKMDVLC